MNSSFLCFILLFICSADGFRNVVVTRCVFNSTELEDIEFITSYFYNKLEFVRFSSNVGKFVGYTQYGMRNAENWNNDVGFLAAMRAQKETYCLTNIGIYYQDVLSKSAEPSVKLYRVLPPRGHHPALLVCSVYDFYPKTIQVSWLRDGQEVTSNATSTRQMENGDWFYQIHSQLEYTPRSGEKISCKVEHGSLKEPLIVDWDPSLQESDMD